MAIRARRDRRREFTEHFFVVLWNAHKAFIEEQAHEARIAEAGQRVWTEHRLKRWRRWQKQAQRILAGLDHADRMKVGAGKVSIVEDAAGVGVDGVPTLYALADSPSGSGPREHPNEERLLLMKFLVHGLRLSSYQAAAATSTLLAIFFGLKQKSGFTLQPETIRKWWFRLHTDIRK